MSGNSEDTARLISGLLDARLPEAERLRLEVQLETDAQARRLYLQMVEQEVELSCIVVPVDAGKVVSLAAAKRGWPRALWWSAAAAVVLLAALWWLPPRAPEAFAASTTWEADFENGSASGWVGELVSTNLPPGSRHGLRSIRKTDANVVIDLIALPPDWDAGLFALTARSTLHLTYRVNRPQGMDVLMHTLSENAMEKASMYRLTGAQFPGTIQGWQTASIPFALFVRKVPDPTTGEMKFMGGPPHPGEAVAALSFSLPDELDLTIDRIWITPDGTGTETLQPLP